MKKWKNSWGILAFAALLLQWTSGASAAGVASGKGYIAAANSASPPNGPFETTVFVIMIVLLVLIALSILLSPLWITLLIKRNRRKLAAEAGGVAKTHQDNLAVLYQIEQDLAPMIKMADGKSQAFLSETEGKYNKLLQMATSDSEIILNYKPGIFKIGKAYKQYVEAKNRVPVITQEIHDVSGALSHYRELEVQVAVKAKDFQRDWEFANKQLQEAASATGYDFAAYFQRGKEIKEKLDHNQNSLSFDPLTNQTVSEKMEQDLQQWKRNVDSLHKLGQQWTTLPESLKATQGQIEELSEQEKLIFAETNPYELLEEAKSKLPQIGACVEKCELNDGNELVNEVLHLRETALSIVQDTIEARRWATSALTTVKDLFVKTDNRYGELTGLLEEVKQEYAAVHWSDYQKQLDDYHNDLRRLPQQMAEIEKSISSEIQRYLAGKESLAQVIETLEKLDKTDGEIRELQARLDQEFSERTQQLREIQNKYNETVLAINEEKVRAEHRLEVRGTEADSNLTEVVQALELRPRDISAVNEALKQAEASVNRLEILFNRVIEERDNVQQRLEDLESSFTRAKRHLGPFRTGSYSSRYKEIHKLAVSAIEEFNYEEAEELITSGESIVQTMEEQYESEEAERREKAAVERRIAEAVKIEMREREKHHHHHHDD